MLLRDAVDDGDTASIWHVDEDLAGIRVDLEGFGMGPDRNVTNLAAGRRIDDGQRPAAISDEDSLSRGVNANIVGVATKLDLSRRSDRLALAIARSSWRRSPVILRTVSFYSKLHIAALRDPSWQRGTLVDQPGPWNRLVDRDLD